MNPSVYQGERIGDPQYQGFTLADIIRYESDDTFEKADFPGLRAIRVVCQGAGQGGSGADTTSSGQVSAGRGGFSGVYAKAFILASELDASEPIEIGEGGAGSTTSSGSAGGTTSFGSHCSADGGTSTNSPSTGAIGQIGFGSSPVTTGVGDLVLPGGAPKAPLTRVTPGTNQRGQMGADSRFGTGGLGSGANNSDGENATGYGSGGGGGANNASQGTVRTGGAGAPGIVIVELYF